MREKLVRLQEQARQDLRRISSLDDLNEFRIKYMGKKGELTQVLRGMGQLSPEERPVIGQMANVVRDWLEQELRKQPNG